MPYQNTYYTRPKKLSGQIFSQLLAEDLENKRAYPAKWDCYCSKCGKDILEKEDFFYYGKSQKICVNCHAEAIDWLQNGLF